MPGGGRPGGARFRHGTEAIGAENATTDRSPPVRTPDLTCPVRGESDPVGPLSLSLFCGVLLRSVAETPQELRRRQRPRSLTLWVGESDSQNAFGVVAEAGDGPADQTAGGLGGDTELLADLAEALALAVLEAEAGLHGEAGAGLQRVEQLVEQIALDEGHHVVLGGAVAIGHEVAERGVAVVADGLVEADRRGEAVQFGVGLVERLTVAGGLAQRSAEAGGAIAGDADEARLLVQRAADGLADPERGVGGELEAAAPVELVDGVLEAEVALLDEVEQVHSLGERVAAGDAHHEAEVRADEPILRSGCRGDLRLEGGAALAVVELLLSFPPCLDDTGELALVLGGEEGDLADVVQVETNGVVHDD